MLVKGVTDEDFSNYKLPSLFVACPTCTFKCERDCGKPLCQNSSLTLAPSINISIDDLIKRFDDNYITQAVVFGGLEPLDSIDDLLEFIKKFRSNHDNDIVIYTGYTEDECKDKLLLLKLYNNIIIKFGRFIPDQFYHYDEVLGIKLASNNQYGKLLSNVDL